VLGISTIDNNSRGVINDSTVEYAGLCEVIKIQGNLSERDRVILTQDSRAYQQEAEQQRNLAVSKGNRIMDTMIFPVGTRDYSPYIMKIKSLKAGRIIYCGTLDAEFRKQILQFGL
jgi:hypothetical protein